MVSSHWREYFLHLYYETNRLVIYRNLLNDRLLGRMRDLLWHAGQEGKDSREIENLLYELASLLVAQAEKNRFGGHVWRAYLLHLLARDENPFSRAAEKFGLNFHSAGLHTAAIYDLKILSDFASLDLENFAELFEVYLAPDLSDYQPTKTFRPPGSRRYWEQFQGLAKAFGPRAISTELADRLARFYHSMGCGEMGIYHAFRWLEDSGLCGIEQPDPVELGDLIGYEQQKETAVNNTAVFVQGRPANNLLLYGERGTGKSSTIKALANRFAPGGLRLVEVPKHQLPLLPQIMDKLRGRAQRFIIFIDDLSFESDETEYKYLKAILEGGIEVNPDNVLIYATSNRRHLIQENWSDREGPQNEVHILDSVQEKMSLADRFGITITYTSPDQEQYLDIVQGLARKHGIEMPAAQLQEMALKWERWHNTRSGRTARQFINHLLGRQ